MTNRITKEKMTFSIRLLFSYLIIILAPAAAIILIFNTMQNALLDIQTEQIQSLSREAVIAYNKEIEQLHKVAEYMILDEDLKQYMQHSEGATGGESFFFAYELAQAYPDYVMVNRLIKNAYIIPQEGDYIIQIPRVIPNNYRGIYGLGILNPEGLGIKLDEYLYEAGRNRLFYADNDAFKSKFYILYRFFFETASRRSGVAAIEIDEKQIRALLAQTLGEEEGVAFLTDETGRILLSYGMDSDAKAEGIHWEEGFLEMGWKEEELLINHIRTDYNNWSVITAVPRALIFSRIDTVRSILLLTCAVSILIGILICLYYWNRDKEILKKCLYFLEKQEEDSMGERKAFRMWLGVERVIRHAEVLHSAVAQQKEKSLEGIVRNILHGNYEEEQAPERELQEIGMEFPVSLPCYVIKMNTHSFKSETGKTGEVQAEEIQTHLKELFAGAYLLPDSVEGESILLVEQLQESANRMDAGRIKQVLEQFHYDIYSRIPLTFYMGISEAAGSLTELADEYEHAERICEYAFFNKIRTPCVMADIPESRFVVFTIEMEMQLENVIQNGTREQLEESMIRIMEICRYTKGKGTHPHAEILRHILLRSLDDNPPEGLAEAIHRAKYPSDMESCVWKLWEHYEKKRIQSKDRGTERLKKQIEEKMDLCYSSPGINLTILAEELNLSEKKLYRDFKTMFGVSFSTYLEMKRIHHAQNHLKAGMSIAEVALQTGYGSDYSFRRAFKRVIGVTPSDYQKMYINNEES